MGTGLGGEEGGATLQAQKGRDPRPQTCGDDVRFDVKNAIEHVS